MVTFVGSDSGDTTGGTDITLTLPTHQADDVAIIWHYSDQDTGTHAVTGETYTELFDGLSSLGRDMHVSVWGRRFPDGSETNPTVTLSNTEEHSASVHVFRNVHPDIGLEDFVLAFANDDNIAEPSEDVVPGDVGVLGDNYCALRLMAITHDDITTVGTPTGYPAGGSRA